MDLGAVQWLGEAFLGGLILNVMPCVLPVLTMKVFHVVEHGGDSPRQHRLHGIAYAAGILATFLVFAGAVVLLRAAGETLGWGMHFQSPAFVAAMTTLIFVFGLNALGVFEFQVSVSGGQGMHGYAGSFVNGIVASVMSTPCSAPFLGSAAVLALGAGTAWWLTVLLFLCIGLGLASPFLVISFVPALGKVLPRPGAWMETAKKLMGFSLMAAAVWQFTVLQAQVSRDASGDFLWFLLIVGVALWALDHFGGLEHELPRRLGVRFAAAALVAAGGLWLIDLQPPPKAPVGYAVANDDAPVVVDDKIQWASFDAQRIAREHKRNRPVFVDFTADWCVNCKTNEKLFIETARIRAVLQDTRILPMKADMTVDNEELDAWLAKLGRSGIPAYVIYLPDGNYDLLPEAITTELLATHLRQAAERFPAAGTTAQAGG